MRDESGKCLEWIHAPEVPRPDDSTQGPPQAGSGERWLEDEGPKYQDLESFQIPCDLTPMEKSVRDNMEAHFQNWCETWGKCEQERTQNELYDIVMKQQQEFNDKANSLRARSMKPHQLMRGTPKAGQQPSHPVLTPGGDIIYENVKRTKKLKIIIENNKKLIKRNSTSKLKISIN
jgi:hypothetical protein